MNIKPTNQQVFEAVGKTQDGGKLNQDAYSNFLRELIVANTETNVLAPDAGETDTEELASNLRYAIHEFGKALEAVEKLNLL